VRIAFTLDGCDHKAILTGDRKRWRSRDNRDRMIQTVERRFGLANRWCRGREPRGLEAFCAAGRNLE